MNESQKESIVQEFQKKIQPLVGTISSFIDECGLGEKEKFSLTRIHSSFQSTISETVNAILNNQSSDTIIQKANNIDNEFTRFIKRITYFLSKDQDTPEIPAILSTVQSNIRISIDFLTNAINQTSIQQYQEQSLTKNSEIPEENETKRRRKDIQPISQEKEIENTKEETQIEPSESLISANTKEETQIEPSESLISVNTNEKQQDSRNIKESKDVEHNQIEVNKKFKNEDSNINIKEQINTKQESQIPTNENAEENDQQNDIQPKNKHRIKRRTKSKKNQTQTQNDTSITENLQNETQNDEQDQKASPKENQQEITIDENIIIEPINFETKADLINQIQSLNNEINTVKLRSSMLEKKLFELTQQSSNWTQSHIDEKCDDPESALFDLLLEQQDALSSRIKKMTNLNESLSLQIEEDNERTNQIIRNNKRKEEEISKEIDDLIQAGSENRLNKANLDKNFFDLNMEIHDINELFKMEQRNTENSRNHLSDMAEKINSIEESNNDLRTKIKFYHDKCIEVENEIDLMKSRKTTNKIEALYQTMQEAEIDLFKTQKEYDTLVNSTIPDLQYKLMKISEEVGHLAAINRKEQEKAELVNLQYIKDNVLDIFRL